ncbi:ATP-binding cassette domain-containing protein, partial [Campylobacter sp. MIT 97-5078]
MLELAHLYKSFKDKLILKDINLKLEKGKIIAIIGSSGAGKSTLLRCINLLEIPTSGSLRLDNLSLDFKHINKKDIAAFRQKTAMVFQHH